MNTYEGLNLLLYMQPSKYVKQKPLSILPKGWTQQIIFPDPSLCTEFSFTVIPMEHNQYQS